MALEAGAQARFDRLREEHYPAHLNRIAAHLTLFHALPASEEVLAVLAEEAAALRPFAMRVTGLMSLGRGVAYVVESSELKALHRRLSAAFAAELNAQDRQGFRPHIVVQNKATGDGARALRERLQAVFVPGEIAAEGLAWWDYLGGPWRLREVLRFGE